MPELAVGQVIQLPKDASKYLTRVLRRGAGDAVTLFTGDGHNYPAELNEDGNLVTAAVLEKAVNHSESPLTITLVQSLAKGSKFDLVIQKATELGVSRIVPVTADRSVMQIDKHRLQKKLAHWQSIAISACTQCGRSKIPTIDTPANLSDCFYRAASEGLLLHPESEHSISDTTITSQQCTLFIGPEGGFSDEEVTAALNAGVRLATCGPRILRTETAGFTALSILQSRFGDL